MKQGDSSRDGKETFGKLAEAAAKVFKNAELLYTEAVLLRKVRSYARALFLHQISMEECAKVDMLGAFGMAFLMGSRVDRKAFHRALADHRAKNFVNAYMIPPSEEERAARERRDWKGALVAFKRAQAEFHSRSNTAKNSALYVDIKDGVATAPADVVRKAMVDNLGARNKAFLAQASSFVNVLCKWERRADGIGNIAKWFASRAGGLRLEKGDDLQSSLSTLLSEAMEKMRDLNRDAASEGSRGHTRK